MTVQKVSPKVRMRDTEMKPAEDFVTQAGRVAVLALVLLAPVAALVAGLSAMVFARIKKVHPGLFAALFAGLFVLTAMFGGLRAFFTGWRAVIGVFRDGSANLLNAREVLAPVAAAEWPHWLLMQVPLSIPLGLFIGACVAASRRRYSARWRKPVVKPLSAKALDRAIKRAPEWPQKTARTLDDVRVRLGVDRVTGKPWDVPVSALRHHGFIVGPSGFGKTTTIVELLRGLLTAPAAQPYKIGVMFVTMKPDPEVTDALRALAQRAGRRFRIVTHDGQGESLTYNPLRHGTAAHRRNLLMEAEANAANGGFSEPHYQRTGSRFTLLALRALGAAVDAGQTYTSGGCRRPWRMDLEHLARMMRMDRLAEVRDSAADPDVSAALTDYLREVEEDRATASGVGGMRSRFAVVAEGAAGAVLRDADGGLDLREAIRAGDVVVMNLDAARDMEAAQYVANLAIADWTAAMSDLAADGWHRAGGAQNRLQYLVVDEFSALGGSGLRAALERARSQGGAVLLSTQSYGELAENSTKGFRASLITNTSVKLLHQVDDKAEDLASLVSTVKTHKETTQIFEDRDLMGSQTRASGQGSLREVDEFRVHPNVLKDLQPGEVVAMVRHPQEIAQIKVRRTPPEVLAARSELAPPAAPGVPIVTAPASESTGPHPEESAPSKEPRPKAPAEQVSDADAWAVAASAATPSTTTPEPVEDDEFVPIEDEDE